MVLSSRMAHGVKFVRKRQWYAARKGGESALTPFLRYIVVIEGFLRLSYEERKRFGDCHAGKFCLCALLVSSAFSFENEEKV